MSHGLDARPGRVRRAVTRMPAPGAHPGHNGGMAEPMLRSGTTARLLEGLVSALAWDRRARGGARLVVGIAGPPGSGKSTLAAALEERLEQEGLLAGSLPMDGFHLSNAVLGQLGRRERKGAPDTFDVEGFVTALDRVRAPGAPEVMVPVYQRDLHEPIAAGSLIRGSGVVVCEGNYLAVDSGGWQAVRERIDLLIFLDVPGEELVRRLVARHEAFGKQQAQAAHWVRTVDVPNAQLVSAGARRCDEIWQPQD